MLAQPVVGRWGSCGGEGLSQQLGWAADRARVTGLGTRWGRVLGPAQEGGQLGNWARGQADAHPRYLRNREHVGSSVGAGGAGSPFVLCLPKLFDLPLIHVLFL